jgi:hypothetical protein
MGPHQNQVTHSNGLANIRNLQFLLEMPDAPIAYRQGRKIMIPMPVRH